MVQTIKSFSHRQIIEFKRGLNNILSANLEYTTYLLWSKIYLSLDAFALMLNARRK